MSSETEQKKRTCANPEVRAHAFEVGLEITFTDNPVGCGRNGLEYARQSAQHGVLALARFRAPQTRDGQQGMSVRRWGPRGRFRGRRALKGRIEATIGDVDPVPLS